MFSSKQRTEKRGLEVKTGIKILTVTFFLVLLDQIVKIIIAANLKGRDPLVLIPNVFEFYYYENPFAAFNFGKQFSSVFLTLVLILTVCFCAFLIIVSFHISNAKKYWFIRLVVILFLAGAIGNFIDRVIHHYVIDFFYFVLINFPIFNIADIYVVSGAIVFVVTALFRGSVYDELLSSRKKKSEASIEEEKHDDGSC